MERREAKRGAGLAVLARALERGLIREEQAERLLTEAARYRAAGRHVGLETLLVRRGYVRATACHRLCEEVEREKRSELETASANATSATPARRPAGHRPTRRPRRRPQEGPRPDGPRPGPQGLDRDAPSSETLEAVAVGPARRIKDRPVRPIAPSTGGAFHDVLDADLPGLTVIDQIGRGSMGKVYRARQRLLGRTVAIKVLPLEEAGNSTLARFRDEALLAARLHHPNIAWVLEAGTATRFLYIVLEYVPGTDLATELEERGPLSENRALRLAERIARGLAHAHAQGVVHQDLKPANVLLRRDWEPVITDFGLAASLDGAHGVTSHPSLFGTYPYIPPEDLGRGRREPSVQGDIYALGVTVFRMLSGELPYRTCDIRVLADAARRHGTPTLAGRTPRPVAPTTEAVMRRALAVEAKDRFKSADEMAAAFAAARRAIGGL